MKRVTYVVTGRDLEVSMGDVLGRANIDSLVERHKHGVNAKLKEMAGLDIQVDRVTTTPMMTDAKFVVFTEIEAEVEEDE